MSLLVVLNVALLLYVYHLRYCLRWELESGSAQGFCPLIKAAPRCRCCPSICFSLFEQSTLKVLMRHLEKRLYFHCKTYTSLFFATSRVRLAKITAVYYNISPIYLFRVNISSLICPPPSSDKAQQHTTRPPCFFFSCQHAQNDPGP